MKKKKDSLAGQNVAKPHYWTLSMEHVSSRIKHRPGYLTELPDTLRWNIS